MQSNAPAESKVIQSIRMEGSPWQIGFSPDGKTLLIVGNDSRAIFLFEHGKREDDGKETWNRLDTPKHVIEQGNAVSPYESVVTSTHSLSVDYGFLLVKLRYSTCCWMYRWLSQDP